MNLRPEKTNELLGVDIPPETQVDFLNGSASNRRSAGSHAFRIPTFRVISKREADLIEEIGRLYGVDKIPATPPRGAIGANAFDAVHDQIAEARRLLAGLGLLEAQGQTLISDAAAKLRDAAAPAVALQNPLSSDMNVLRPSLLPGLLDSLRHNVSRKNDDVALFEIGRVFVPTDGKFKEERRLGLALTGRRLPAFWSGAERDAKFDIYDLKGVLEEFLEHFGLRGVTWPRASSRARFFWNPPPCNSASSPWAKSASLSPGVQKQYDLRDAVFLAELNFDLMLARRNPAKSFKPLPAYPAIRRDVAMLVPEATLHEAVLNVVRQAKPQNLEKLELFDVFRGKNVPAGQKSVAYAFTYRNAERTLTDAEVNAAHAKLIEQLRQTLHATVRDA